MAQAIFGLLGVALGLVGSLIPRWWDRSEAKERRTNEATQRESEAQAAEVAREHELVLDCFRPSEQFVAASIEWAENLPAQGHHFLAEARIAWAVAEVTIADYSTRQALQAGLDDMAILHELPGASGSGIMLTAVERLRKARSSRVLQTGLLPPGGTVQPPSMSGD